ncbi:MAG: DUF1934 domain-containing protein [Acutalibacteraceae bacterium]
MRWTPGTEARREYIPARAGREWKAVDVWISITGIQRVDGESNVAELSTGGTLEREQDGYLLTYEESEATGMAGVRTALHIRDDGVTMERTGAMNALLVLEAGKRHMCEYDTGYGKLMMGVYTQEMNNHLAETGGELALRYTLDFNAGLAAAHELRVSVREIKQ